jgi:hypothetical protein
MAIPDYDDLLMAGVDRREARQRIRADVEQILEKWRNSSMLGGER